jgi:hypothetical protein
VALLVAAFPAAAQFSHRIHLAKKVDCVVCHSGAPGSTAAADNLLPKPEVCRSCHPGMKASIKDPRNLTVSKFNHQLHVKLGPSIAPLIGRAIESGKFLGPADAAARDRGRHPCTGCHTGLEKSDTVTEAAFPHMADCLVCHNQIDPPFSCAKCHEQSPSLKPVSHTSDWVDLHSSKTVGKTGCAVCHGRNFTCLGCH